MLVAILLLILSPYTAIIPGLYAMIGVFTRRFRLYLNTWNIGLFALFLISIVSGIINKSMLSITASLMLLMYFCISIVMEDSFNSEGKIISFYIALLYFSVIPGIIGIVEKICSHFFNITLIKRLIYVTPEVDGRICSTFSNPNIAGGWFAAMLLIAVFFWSRNEIKHRLTLVLLVLLYSANLLLSGSRGAIMGLASGMLVLLIMKKGWRKLIMPGIILCLITLISLIPGKGSIINSLMGHQLSSSFISRYPIWKGTVEMIFEKPVFGWGLMGIYEKGSLFFDPYKVAFHAHNIWLSMLSMLGFIGFYVYLIVRVYVIYGLSTLKRNNCSLTPLLASIQALVIVHGLVDFVIIVPQTGILFVTCCAFINSLSRSFSTTPQLHQLPAWPLGITSKYRTD